MSPRRKFSVITFGFLLLFGVLSVLLLLPRNSALASIRSDTAPAVKTVPTLPTIPTHTPTKTPTEPHKTATPTPTGPTHTPTNTPTNTSTEPTNTPTKTPIRPTKTPTPTGTVEGLDPLDDSPLFGNFCKASGGVGLKLTDTGSFPMNVTGRAVRAYLYWAGRYPSGSGGDDQVQIAINGGAPIAIKAEQSRKSDLGNGTTYYTYQSANLVNDMRFTGLLNGNFTVTAWDLRSAGIDTDEGYGIGLVIISEDPSCPYGQLDLFYGLDSFDHTRRGELGPNSEVLCVQFEPADAVRTLAFQAFIGGAEGVNAVWYRTGTGLPPTELITNGSGAVLDGPPLTAVSPFISKEGQQWDNYTNSLTIPANATYACFQLESVPPIAPNSAPGTTAVWVNFISCLFTPSVPPTVSPVPTVSANATPTPTPRAAFTLKISVNPTNPSPGDSIIYALNYANTGQVALKNMVLRLTIPAHMTFDPSKSTPGWNCNGAKAGSICEYNLGDVLPGQTGKVLFAVTLDQDITSATGPIVLGVQAQDANRLINITTTTEVTIVIGQQSLRTFLPLIHQ